MPETRPVNQPGHTDHVCAWHVCRPDGAYRVRIVRAAGTEVFPGIIAADPDVAKPNIGREGWCTAGVPDPAYPKYTNPRIELDGGGVIWGYECWWEHVLTPEGEAYMENLRKAAGK